MLVVSPSLPSIVFQVGCSLSCCSRCLGACSFNSVSFTFSVCNAEEAHERGQDFRLLSRSVCRKRAQPVSRARAIPPVAPCGRVPHSLDDDESVVSSSLRTHDPYSGLEVFLPDNPLQLYSLVFHGNLGPIFKYIMKHVYGCHPVEYHTRRCDELS